MTSNLRGLEQEIGLVRPFKEFRNDCISAFESFSGLGNTEHLDLITLSAPATFGSIGPVLRESDAVEDAKGQPHQHKPRTSHLGAGPQSQATTAKAFLVERFKKVKTSKNVKIKVLFTSCSTPYLHSFR